ncbi:MAG TPA: ASCH domain-containing protein [Spirillospora sp.]|nr:ASCH domain-containing protein [Spirillospora sp.]
MSETPIAQFWQRYLDTLPEEHPHRTAAYTAWSFGDNESLADELARLVLQGIKTATASALWEYESEGQAVSRPGDLSIILSGDARPLCIIETVEIHTLPFNAVDAQFAADEGEGDRSLAYWREAHRRFFTRTLSAIGREFSETMPVVCERFRVVFAG